MGRGLNGTIMTSRRSLAGTVLAPAGKAVVRELSKLEQRIFADYVVPLVKGDLVILKRNSALLIYYKEQLEKHGAAKYFIDIIDFVSQGIGLLEEVDELRSKVYSGDGLGQLYFKTSRVRLLAEFELYNALIGAPDMRQGERYDMAKIAVIKNLLNNVKAADLDYALIERVISST
jgi:hypothetical protein